MALRKCYTTTRLKACGEGYKGSLSNHASQIILQILRGADITSFLLSPISNENERKDAETKKGGIVGKLRGKMYGYFLETIYP